MLEEAKGAGMRPNTVMYTTLLNAYGQAGQLQAATDVLAEMQQAGVEPEPRTYTSLLSWWDPQLLMRVLACRTHCSTSGFHNTRSRSISGVEKNVHSSFKLSFSGSQSTHDQGLNRELALLCSSFLASGISMDRA